MASGFKQAEYKYAKSNALLQPRDSTTQAKLRIEKFGPNIPGTEARERLSKRQSENNSGGRSKWFTVSGKKVQGTWERDFAQFLDDNDVNWERCESWSYIIDGVTRRYTPDFYLSEYELYVEIKGHWWGNDRAKMDAVIQQYPDKKILIIEDLDFSKYMPDKLI